MKNPENDRHILIASSSLDEPTWGRVAERLDRMGHDVVVFQTDLVASGKNPISITVDPNSGLSISYLGRPIDFSKFGAAWRRRPNMYPNDGTDWAAQQRLLEERKSMLSILWSTVPENAWLNSPDNMRRADEKTNQLLVARDLGMNIPKTVISNDWQDITSSLPEEIALKMAFGVLYDGDNIKTMYTQRLRNNPEDLPTSHNPFPGFWQPFIQKAREWRITAVGDETFDAAIYTKEQSSVDWRQPQSYSGVKFRAETFPVDIKEKCLKYLGHFALKFGAFDFIEDQDGRYIFLECNPNGQYAWIEDELDFPISGAIASELSTIAKC